MDSEQIGRLRQTATRIRQLILMGAFESGRKPHPGPALSSADICTAVYFGFMNLDPSDPKRPDRDRFILSKGHGALVQYACLAELGFFPKSELATVRHLNSRLQGHPTMDKTPGVDMTTGSLGNGLGVGLGMAHFLKNQGMESKVFVVLGDGEMNEGTVWEAVSFAAALRQDNLIAIIDQNGFQSCGSTASILPLPNLAESVRSFGWKTFEVNGHDMSDLVSKLEIATNYRGAPVCLLAHTVKGKGVPFMEHNNRWHQQRLGPQEFELALTQLGANRE